MSFGAPSSAHPAGARASGGERNNLRVYDGSDAPDMLGAGGGARVIPEGDTPLRCGTPPE
ncbi:hypothetical protein GCM10010102_27900 [Promicromonospora citrea]|uniref:Uncharacterized protein n=1 Tax=Promicromonospora citrea TaxID=43677 RepID=A0A8H9GM39_9MICO|nr:hypothetical protein GCM10010102_27900 [Promicromonospora citrea]